MNRSNTYPKFSGFIRRRARAAANIKGSYLYNEINGTARFYETAYGILVVTEIEGLPKGNRVCESPILALHIHDGGSCSGTRDDPFSNAGMHYNPNACPHPYHAGDLPPLFSANGHAFSAFLTDRFTLEEVVGKTIVVHSSPDDFTTQPAGNAGAKIACGEIVRMW